MSGTEIETAVQTTVQDAADEAVETVRTEHAVEVAADRVESAAERVEDAAEAHSAATVTPDIGSIIAEHFGPIHARLDGMEARLTPVESVTPDDIPDPEEIAPAIVDEIVERAEDAIGDEPDAGDLGGEIPDSVEDAPEAVEQLADAVTPDTPPRNSHWMNRPLFGRRG